MPRWHSILVLLAAAPLASCGAHMQKSGTYVFTAQEILRDDCGVLASSTALGTGTLMVRGESVTLEYAPLAMQLQGFFEEASDDFYLDGTAANVTATLRGATCVVDLVSVHLDGSSVSASAFTGAMRTTYDAATPSCTCELWALFRAELGEAAAALGTP